MSFVNAKQDPDSLDVMLHKHILHTALQPRKTGQVHTQTDNYRGTKEPWKLKGEGKDSPDTQSSRQQPSALLSLFHYNGNTIIYRKQSI